MGEMPEIGAETACAESLVSGAGAEDALRVAANREEDAHPTKEAASSTDKMARTATKRACRSALPEVRPQLFTAGCMPQPSDGFLLDLTHPLAGKLKLFSNLFQCK